MKIFVAVTHEEVESGTLEDRVKLLSDKGVPIVLEDGKPVVQHGTLEMWMDRRDDEEKNPGVLFTWYSEDEVVP